MNAHQTAAFWSWFERHADALCERIESGDAAAPQEIDSRLRLALPGGRWEIGPLGETEWFFALSLRGSLEQLLENQKFVDCAPKIDGWRFLPSKPRKSWSRRVMRFGRRTVDFDSWRLSMSNRTLFFTPSADADESFTEAELEGACWFLLEAELGELEALSSISEVELVRGIAGVSAAELFALWSQRR